MRSTAGLQARVPNPQNVCLIPKPQPRKSPGLTERWSCQACPCRCWTRSPGHRGCGTWRCTLRHCTCYMNRTPRLLKIGSLTCTRRSRGTAQRDRDAHEELSVRRSGSGGSSQALAAGLGRHTCWYGRAALRFPTNALNPQPLAATQNRHPQSMALGQGRCTLHAMGSAGMERGKSARQSGWGGAHTRCTCRRRATVPIQPACRRRAASRQRAARQEHACTPRARRARSLQHLSPRLAGPGA